MSFERLDYSGNAVQTTVVGPTTATTLSWNIDDPTGWPLGTNGKFGAVFDRGGPNEEKVRCTTLTGSTITLAGTSDRGADGTTPKSHLAAESFEHCYFAQDADEANLTGSQTLGQVVAKGDVLTGRSTQRLQRTPVGSNDALWICDSSQPGGMRFGSVPTGGINSAAQIADGIITNAKLAVPLAHEVAYAENTTLNQGINTSEDDVLGVTVTATVLTGRVHMVRAAVGLIVQNTSGGFVKVRITDGAGAGLRTFVNESLGAGERTSGEGSRRLTGLSGSVTFKVRAVTSAATMNVVSTSVDPGPAWIQLLDIGPA